jgi:hypothetical protein
MDLLDRYLAAVRSNLPAARADDITGELRGELLDQVEAREAALGRPLDRTEIVAMLKAFGRPIVVATRYRDHQQLIGSEIYPFYLHALRVVAVITLAVFVFSAVVPILTGNAYFVRAFTHGVVKAGSALLTAFAIVTLLFAIMERAGAPRALLANWQPEQLPDTVRLKKSPWELAFDFGISLALLLWMLGAIPLPAEYTGKGVHIEFGAAWTQYYWPIVLLVTARLGFALFDWLRPAAIKLRALLSLALATLEFALISLLLARGSWAIVSATTSTADQAARAGIGINVAIRVALTVALIAAGVRLVVGVYRLVMPRAQSVSSH